MRSKGHAAAANPPIPEWWPRHLLDEQPAADLIGVSVMTLQGWRCRKTVNIPYCKVGTRVKYVPDDLWRWLCANTVRPAAVCA